jgi:hypothetical protein
VATGGLSGLLDYVGYGVAQGASPHVVGGFLFLDFVGYPVAGGTGLVIFTHGHGAKVGGKPSAIHLFLLEAMYRQQQRKPKPRRSAPIMAQKLIMDALVEHGQATQQKRMVEQAMYAVALAEC